ncbi:MAG TPA: glycosyltransferase family 9 protein [Candidatus Aquilonibacter sp.]|nr:glycosyltransferase family 9 protein [Candidatus Aquilonibacter sp.]
MAPEALPPRTFRQRTGYVLRYTLTTLFRAAVRGLRLLRIVPTHSADRAQPTMLIVHLTPHLGDAIMVMPMIEALRASNPDARIEFAVEASAAVLLRSMPELDHVYGLQLGQEPPATPFRAIGRALLVSRVWWKHMRGLAPGICLMPRWDNDQYRSSLLAWLLDAPQRIGFASDAVPSSRPAPYRDRFLTRALRGGSGLHEAEHFCLLAAEAGLIPASAVPQAGNAPLRSLRRIAELEDWPSLAERLGVDPTRPFAIVAPGASMPRKVWPIARWAQVCDALSDRGFDVVVLSGPSDRACAEELHKLCGSRTILAAGVTTLLESATLLSRSSVFLGGDSGPGHLAGALGTPCVILFASIAGGNHDDVLSPHRIRPLGPSVVACCPPHNLPPCNGGCRATEAHCLTLIDLDQVLSALDTALEPSAAASPAVLSANPGALSR